MSDTTVDVLGVGKQFTVTNVPVLICTVASPATAGQVVNAGQNPIWVGPTSGVTPSTGTLVQPSAFNPTPPAPTPLGRGTWYAVADAGYPSEAVATAFNSALDTRYAGIPPINAVAASGTTQALLANTYNRYVMSANCTFSLPPPVAGMWFYAAFIQPASGGPFTPTITSAKYGTTGPPTWSTVANKKDIVGGTCDDNATWDVAPMAQGDF